MGGALGGVGHLVGGALGGVVIAIVDYHHSACVFVPVHLCVCEHVFMCCVCCVPLPFTNSLNTCMALVGSSVHWFCRTALTPHRLSS